MDTRPATPGDAEDIAAIQVHTWQVAYAGIVPAEVLADKQPTPDAAGMREYFSRPDRRGATLVAVDDAATVLGYTHYGPARADTGTDDEGEIYAIYVRPPHWSTGAGRALLTGALADLAVQGRTVVRLWVFGDNDRARRFYQLGGFVADGLDRVERFPDGTGFVDLTEVRMTRVG